MSPIGVVQKKQITIHLHTMNMMFYSCYTLTSLNLSNFDTSSVTRINKMFYGCNNLEYINLKNFNENKLSDDYNYYSFIFDLIPENVVICINEDNNRNKIIPQIKNKTCYTIDCSDNWKSVQKK